MEDEKIPLQLEYASYHQSYFNLLSYASRSFGLMRPL